MPFVISTGLAFTDFSNNIFHEAGFGWLKYIPNTPYGDVVGFVEELYPSSSDFDRTHREIDGYHILVPPKWELDEYLCMRDNLREGASIVDSPSSPDDKISDYAVILRHTHYQSEKPPQVWFVVAGFTAHGTAAASEYLKQNWPHLHDEYFRDYRVTEDGDFCQIIVGRSEDPYSWRPPKTDKRHTPRSLAQCEIKCEWAQRFRKHHDGEGKRMVRPKLSRVRKISKIFMG